MSLEIVGKRPTTKRGRVFVTSWWAWKPLALYITQTHEAFAEAFDEETSRPIGLEADRARALGEAIREALEGGLVEGFARQFQQFQADTYARVECSVCQGSGVRTDRLGKARGLDSITLDEFTSLVLGRSSGSCDSCRGEGLVDSPLMAYTFQPRVLENFATFLVECGGFEVES